MCNEKTKTQNVSRSPKNTQDDAELPLELFFQLGTHLGARREREGGLWRQETLRRVLEQDVLTPCPRPRQPSVWHTGLF